MNWLLTAALLLTLAAAGGIWWWFRKQLLAQQARTESLQRQLEQMDDHLARTAHEFRTPLNGIVGLSESVLEGASGRIPDKARDELRIVSASGRRLAHLVNDLVDHARFKQGELTLETHALDLRMTAEMVVQLARPLAKGRPVEIINAVPNDLPAVSADDSRLQQILHNLVGNALKFTDKGQIRIGAEPDDDHVVVSVSDTGIGIPTDERDDLFEAFRKVSSTESRNRAGAGLGLAITRDLVELHGGRIWLEPDDGSGTTFSFTLPCARSAQTRKLRIMPDDEPLSAIDEPDFEIEMDYGLGEFTILVVDDENVSRRVAHNFLSPYYQVIEASDASAALEKIAAGGIDLVLLDVMMPELDGYELAERLRETHLESELPIVMLTARDHHEDLIRGFSVGANDYLTKPVDREELVARVGAQVRILEQIRGMGHQTAERREPIDAGRTKPNEGTDSLTGVPDRQSFLGRASRQAANAPDFCIILADLDDFGAINRDHGCKIGDAVLKAVSQEFRQAAGNGQLMARWGGEEFIFLLPGANLEEAHHVAESLRERLSSIHIGSPPLTVSATFGVARFDPDEGLDACIGTADRALCEGKQEGKNRTVRGGAR